MKHQKFRPLHLTPIAAVCLALVTHLAHAQVADTSSTATGTGSTAKNGSVADGQNATAGIATNPLTGSPAGGAVAIGNSASATGSESIVIGDSATDNGNASALVMGNYANVTGTYAVALGYLATAALDGVTLGSYTSAASGATAIGFETSAAGESATTVGSFANAAGIFGSAIGTGAAAGGSYAAAVGSTANASGYGASAIGAYSTSSGPGTTALGYEASATMSGDVALGNNTTATGSTLTTNYTTPNAIVKGYTFTILQAPTNGSVAVGSRQITQLADGEVSSTSTDAVNGSQLYKIGAGLQAEINQTVMYDNTAHTSVTLGGVGAAAPVTLTNVAPGALSPTSTDAVNGAQLNSTNAILANAVLYNDSTHSAVTLGGASATASVALTNVAPGALTASSTDAVNGSQLYTTNQSVSAVQAAESALASSSAAALGTTTNSAGGINAPSYAVYGASYTNVASAVTALQAGMPVQYSSAAAPTTPLAAGTAPTTNDTTLVGPSSSSPVSLHNLAAGAVTSNSTDAINGSQLYATNQEIANAVMYDNAGHTSVTLGGTTAPAPVALTNVAPGALSASSTDAVNGSQLFATNQQLGNAVMYDSSAHTSVTLGGAGATTPVALTNIAAGALTTTSSDAVNGSQLLSTNLATAAALGTTVNAAGQINAPTYSVYGTSINNVGAAIAALQSGAPVQYSSAATPTTPLAAGTAPTTNDATLVGPVAGAPVTLHNLAPGAVTSSSTDAINGSQLYAVDQSIGNAVMYNDASHTAVTLGGVGSATPVALGNVAAGALSATSTDAVNGSQLFTTNQTVATLASGTAAALGTTVNATGGLNAPAYGVFGSTYNNVGSAIAALQAGAPLQFSSSASPTTPLTVGTAPSTNDVTLVGPITGSPVAVHNVAAGALTATSTDAVNGSQLYSVDQTVASNTSAITNLQAAQADAVVYDSAAHASVTLGGVGAASTVALTNVSAGALTATSTDAVNGSQLVALDQALTNQINSLANTAVTNAGTPAPATSLEYFHVNSTGPDSSATGANAIAIGSSAAATATNAIAEGEAAQANGSNAVAIGANASAPASNSVAIGANSAATRADTVSVGSPGNERQITNVAAGTQATDAVNLQQLNTTAAQLEQGMNGIASKAYAGAASAAALAAIPDVDAGKTIAVGVGTGNYQGYQAWSFGATARLTQNIKLRGGISQSSGGTTWNLGAAMQW